MRGRPSHRRYRWEMALLAVLVTFGALFVRASWRDDGAIIRLPERALVRGVAVSPDGGMLLAATAEGLLRWTLPARSPLPPLDTADSYAVSIRADGQVVAAVQAQGIDGLAVRLLATNGRTPPP